MAVVTLKDLMDPLTKIAKSTEETSTKLDAVIAAVSGGSGGQLSQAIVTELQIQTDLLRQIVTNTKGGSINVGGKPVDQDKLKEGAQAIKMLGGGASSLAFGLIAFMLVPKAAVRKFATTIKDIMDIFDNMDTAKVKQGAEAFEIIAGSIGRFARGLAAASILLIPGLLGALLLKAAIYLLVPTFELLGNSEKNVKGGAEVLGMIGDSLLRFAKGLVMVAIASAIGILFTPIIVLAMLLIGGAFALLGMFDKTIREGARALKMMGAALVWFSVGLVTFALASLFILMEPKILLGMVATIVVLGTAFLLLGLFDRPIRKGAVALVLMSIGLVAFTIGYLIYAIATEGVTLDQILLQAGLLVGLGVAFGLLGQGFVSIVKGAAAVAAIGFGLLVFSLGYMLLSHATKDLTLESVAAQAGLIAALGVEFGVAGLGAGFIILGAAAFASVGGALLLLAPGLEAIKKVDFTTDDAIKLTTTLAGVKSAFLGGKDADEGFFSKLGGAITGAIDSVRMLEAAAGFSAAGLALILLSKGLNRFKEVGWNDELSKDLVVMLNGVTTAFALAGTSQQVPSSSFFGQMFGFTRTAVEEGVNSVLGAGRALKDIADGLISFKALIDSGIQFGEPDENGRYQKGTLGYAVTNTVGFVSEAFAAIADQGNVQAGGIFGSLFGVKKNKVAEGIESVKGAGEELTNIATGLQAFQQMVEQNINWDTLGQAIKKSLTFVGEAFAAIGSGENEEKDGWWIFKWDENKTAKGVAAVKGAGTELTNIANGLKTFQDMITANVDFNALGNVIKTTLTLVGDAFAVVGGKEQTDSTFFGLIEWDENLVQKGIDNVKGAGQELTNIAKGLQSFADLKDPKAIAESIKQIFTSIGDTFTYYYEKPKFSGQLDHMKSFVNTMSYNASKGLIHKAADGMSKMADAINKIDTSKAEAFADLFKGAGELSTNTLAYFQLINAVEEIRDALRETAQPAQTTGTATGGGTGTGGEGTTSSVGLKPVLSNINTVLGNLNTTLNGLPGNIAVAVSKKED